MSFFNQFDQHDLDQRVSKRQGETKLGEKIRLGLEGEKYVLIGVPESIGVRGNLGKTGTESLWGPFLDVFLNIQSTNGFNGSELSILGSFDFSGILPASEASVQAWRNTVEQVDVAVSDLVEQVVLAGKVPIVIGGGHNNCYPIIKGVVEGLYAIRKLPFPAINAVNLDAHADFRMKEGRHSGNGFRYAFEAGYLQKYAVLGLSENYNSQAMIDEMKKSPEIDVIFWEDIFLRQKFSFEQSMQRAKEFVMNDTYGVELDLDVIEGVLSSAMSPVGVSAIQARQYVHHMASEEKVAYLHICEGAVRMQDGRADQNTAKLVAYLVSDYVKANKKY
ncbi:formimidoylglutamase [Echinicola sp. CAU 1574]|uniref:Formimidoylglutamase n=1 Tax=Echinicola arenosa TaxID=2774144 RepID=A0ABR9AR17_9BACT|nr:formimidoylglutamase [Echinicola arenosa]MBD8490308.1 formimidoylglutamase [Echinicola arenosa]